jgi:hypothetical protein
MLSISQKDDLESQLRDSLARLEVELPLVYEIDPAEMKPACRELEGEIAAIARGLAGHMDLLLPCQADLEKGQAHACRICSSFRREAQDAYKSRTGGVSAPGPGASR